MRLSSEEIGRIETEFVACQKTLVAIGDEMRQQLLILMAQAQVSGVRVAELAEKTSLSRPAVSHHLQILKDAGIVKCRKEGRRIYYYFEPNGKRIGALLQLLEDVKATIAKNAQELPEG